MTTPNFDPYLTIVAASRNDDHGGDPLRRTQIFIDSLARQCDQLKLSTELIIVDWNPVEKRPGLAGVLNLPDDSEYLHGKVITVPADLHHQFKYAEKMPFFQMIAKNVGIRRAEGRFIVATNIDIIFSDELMQFIGRQNLDPARLYRVDRYDIKADMPDDLDHAEILDYAWENPIRSNRRLGPDKFLKELYPSGPTQKCCIPTLEAKAKNPQFRFKEEEGTWMVSPEPNVNMDHIHTNACGDFTLLSREGWAAIAGYAEFAGYSFNIDSVGVLAAHYGGFEEISLLPPCVCFHIEHSLGSGWTPEGEKKLFSRLKKAEVISPEWPALELLVDEFRSLPAPLSINDDQWGLADFNLPEEPLNVGNFHDSPLHPWPQQNWSKAPVSALKPQFDLDRITLWHERRNATSNPPESGSGVHHLIQLYVPNASGLHSEDRLVEFDTRLSAKKHTFYAEIKNYHAGTSLRFDPTYQEGVVLISRLELIDPATQTVLWSLDHNAMTCIGIWGTALIMPPPDEEPSAIRLLSTGNDPQLWLPPLAHSYDRLILRFEIAHFPIAGA